MHTRLVVALVVGVVLFCLGIAVGIFNTETAGIVVAGIFLILGSCLAALALLSHLAVSRKGPP